MKTNYLIRTMLFACLLVSSCTEIEETPEVVEVEEINSFDDCPNTSPASNKVRLDSAELEMDLYQLGLGMMPDSFAWDSVSHKITYYSRTITDTKEIKKIDSLTKLYREYYGEDAKYLFSDSNSLARSYFIHREDIECLMDVLFFHPEANGIRMYMAAQSDIVNSSHGFIGPAHLTLDDATNYFLGDASNPYLLDLTTPCPNTCGGKLKPLSN